MQSTQRNPNAAAARARYRLRARAGLAALLAGASLAGVASASARTATSTNLIQNGSCANALGSYSTFTGKGPGPSAATGWEVFDNVSAKTTTDVLSNTQGATPATMCNVVTTSAASTNGNGMVEQWRATGGPAACTFSIWVYLVQGAVQIGVGNGGSTKSTVSDTTPGRWVNLTGHNSTSPCNELTVYSRRVGVVNDWYFQSATVTATP